MPPAWRADSDSLCPDGYTLEGTQIKATQTGDAVEGRDWIRMI